MRSGVVWYGGCEMRLSEIQKQLGTTPDGIFGPKTAAALAAARYDVVLDAGHTADRAREWPCDWPAEAWETLAGRKVARALGFTIQTQDSIEHMLNVSIAAYAARELEQRGLRVLLFEDPGMGNSAEYQLAAKIANAAAPRVFLSIHANACYGVTAYAANTPCGSITFYRVGDAASLKLAEACTTEMMRVRAVAQAPSNRADRIAPGQSYHVLKATPAAGASALAEVGFYDNMADLEFMATHLAELGRALAEAIISMTNDPSSPFQGYAEAGK